MQKKLPQSFKIRWNPLFLWFFVLLLCAVGDLWSFWKFQSIFGHRFRFLLDFCSFAIIYVTLLYSFKNKIWFLYLLQCAYSGFFLAAEIISLKYFGVKITGDMSLMLLGSSPEEMNSFITQLFIKPVFWLCLLFYILFLCFCIFLAKSSRKVPAPPITKKNIIYSICLWVIVIFIVIIQNPYQRTTIIHFFFQLKENYGYYTSLANALRNEAREKPLIKKNYNINNPPFVCVIIGESATKHAWSLYGYKRQTTPKMELLKTELLVFKNVRAAATHTTVAMKYFLSQASPSRPLDFGYSLPYLLKTGGYQISLYSNQSHWGPFDGPVTAFFKSCDEKVYIKYDLPSASLKRSKAFDDDLLPLLQQKFETSKQHPTFVFLHLEGSHIPWRDRTPIELQKYPQAKLATHETTESRRNSYDNSIIFTDYILGEIIFFLKNKDRPSCVFYFSDHGDSPSSGKERNASSYETWDIPAILWSSPSFKQDYSHILKEISLLETQNLQADYFYFMVLKLAGLQVENSENKQ